MIAAESAESGGLFNFDATLPTIVIEFLILLAVLNSIFYQPVTQTIDSRNDYIRMTLNEAQERKQKADQIAQQYQAAIQEARLKSQQLVADAEASAAKVRSQKMAEVQAEVQKRMEAAQAEIDQEKQQALQALEQEVATLSQQISQKLLGAAASR